MKQGQEKYFILASALIVTMSLVLGACRSNRASLTKNADVTGAVQSGTQSEQLSYTFYKPEDFGNGGCADIPGASGIALAENNSFYKFQCQDNFVTVDTTNVDNITDVESNDMTDAQKKGHSLKNELDYLILAHKTCGESCGVRLKDGVYSVNKPNCGNICDGKKYNLTSIKGKTREVFIKSACPAKHWKNVFKEKIGNGINHCASPNHIDVDRKFENDKDFGISPDTQGKDTLRLSVIGAQVSSPVQQSRAPQQAQQSVQAPPSDSRPACTANGGKGYGSHWVQSGITYSKNSSDFSDSSICIVKN